MQKKLQVFVSSTYVDLVEERQAAVSAILKAGHIPAGMELFTAGDKSQLQTIKNWIDQCDVFMLILAGRYGSVEPESGLSYTEIEYNYALEKHKPLFAVVIQEDALEKKTKTDGRSALELENPKLLGEFRKKVLSNISSFFSDAKDIKLCIHESLSDISGNNDLSGWVRASDIPDVDALRAENSKLLKEKIKLESKLRGASSGSHQVFEILEAVLSQQIVLIPKNTYSNQEEDLERPLLMLLDAYKTELTSGISNHVGSSSFNTFMYHKYIPRLMIHGLIEEKNIVGTRFQRRALNKKGLELVAYRESKPIASED